MFVIVDTKYTTISSPSVKGKDMASILQDRLTAPEEAGTVGRFSRVGNCSLLHFHFPTGFLLLKFHGYRI